MHTKKSRYHKARRVAGAFGSYVRKIFSRPHTPVVVERLSPKAAAVHVTYKRFGRNLYATLYPQHGVSVAPAEAP